MKRLSLRLLFALTATALAWLQVAPAAGQSVPPSGLPKANAPAAPAAGPPATPSSDNGDAAMASMIAAGSAEGDRWLALIDHGKFAESWTEAAAVLQEAITQKEWSADLAGRQQKLGRTIMRERKAESYSKTLRGAPTGDYVTVTYLTKFEKTPLVEETLAVARDAIGQWHVAGYDIQLSSAKTP
ncbi:MAG TPA: DUF4019 domain-containing protein [Casimicrobiaceae bacterium]|jgi:hypothetical protein|nr:DUF4019 domain-containing protein [Casimicrobiaceae bacterium]